MTQTIEELAGKRQKWVEANRENGFEDGLKRLLTDLYPDNAHFIYELLQNAEDAEAKEVRFILQKDRIEFEHDGKKLFTIEDVDAITSIGFSTKRDDHTNIGKFGVGFKAVFAYTETPEIKSGNFHFQIHDMVVPKQDGRSNKQYEDKQTRFILPLNNPKKSGDRALCEIETLLRSIDETTVIFLTHIRKIEYLLPDSSIGYIERIDRGENRFEIRVQQPDEIKPSSTWFLKFDDPDVHVEDEEIGSEDQKVKICRIAVAFGLKKVGAKAGAKGNKGDGENPTPQWELVPMEPGRVCIYFPAEKETSNLRFHIHAPFASTVARDSVRNCAGNNVLRDHLAELLAESMHTVRDQGLLTVGMLALLPNNKDNLSPFYKPFMERLVREFQEQELVPMKHGGHAAASGTFRGTRALSDLIDDDDLVMLLDDDSSVPMWVANPPQLNQGADNFLLMLNIRQWDTAELVEVLGKMTNDALAEWMDSKDDKWSQNLYERLMKYIDDAPKYSHASRKDTITCLSLIRCSDGTYRKGNSCFFPTEDVEQDDRFPRVAKGVYISGKDLNKRAHAFLKEVGVREVDERVEIETLLKNQYSQKAVDGNAFSPELNDIRRFIRFADKHPNDIEIFKTFYIFKLKNGEWSKPSCVYLDEPFINTGLNVYYQILDDQSQQWALSDDYTDCEINPEDIGGFARDVGAITGLCIKQESGYNSKDYSIDHLDDLLASNDLIASKLIWRACISHENSYPSFYYKQSRPDGRYNFRRGGDSSIIVALKKHTWVPQKTDEIIEFVLPCDAVAEKLPEGFPFQTDWEWLKILEFGKNVEKRREEQKQKKERQTQEYKRKEEVAIEMGFESPEEAEEIARLKKDNPEEYRKFKEAIAARKDRQTFPDRPVADRERRPEHLKEKLSKAQLITYEMKMQSVRISSMPDADIKTYLRELYMNKEADQMFCQICQKEMPFRKRDGTHYFEKKEVLTSKYLHKEDEAQYLALCPLCAAKYNEFVISGGDDVMTRLKEKIVRTEDCKVLITLGDESTSIRFVERHHHDLKYILKEMG